MITTGKDNTIRIWNLRKLNLRPLVITENAPICNLTILLADNQIIYALATKPKMTKVQYLDTEVMAAELCKLITKNLSIEAWQTYVGADLPYETCCKEYPPGK